MALPVTQDFEDAKRDLDDLALIVNSSDDIYVQTRVGGLKPSLAKVLKRLHDYAPVKNRGVWEAGVAYDVNDIWQAPDSTWYVVVTGYTSGVSASEDIGSGVVFVHQSASTGDSGGDTGGDNSDVWSPYDIGYTEETYLQEPIRAINETLARMSDEAGGGVLQLPAVPVDIDWGAENSSYGLAKIIIPAVAGQAFHIKGHGKHAPFRVNTSAIADTTDTNHWSLFTTGDQADGRNGWDFATHSGGSDNGARSYDMTKFLDEVIIENVHIIGDEPDAAPNLTAVGSYNYQFGGIHLYGAKRGIVKKCRVTNVLTTGIVIGFCLEAWATGNVTEDIGHRKFSGAPANGIDIVGLGADAPDDMISSAVVFGNFAKDVHDVGFMTVWSDTRVTHCVTYGCGLGIENQTASFVTDREDIGGNVSVEHCFINGKVSHWSTFTKYSDAIVMNGGKNKAHSICNTSIVNCPNMAVAGYTDGSSMNIENLYLRNTGTSNYHEFPTILWSGGPLHISGGVFQDINHTLVQVYGSTATLTWGARTKMINLKRSIYAGGGQDGRIFQVKAEIIGTGYCTVGISSAPTDNIDLDFLVKQATSSNLVKLATWDDKAVSVSGKVKIDYGWSDADLRPITSYLEGSEGFIDVEVVNRNTPKANPTGTDGLQTNSSFGYVNPNSMVLLNGKRSPFGGAALSVNFLTGRVVSSFDINAKLNTLVTNINNQYMGPLGLHLHEKSALNSLPASDSLPVDKTAVIQLDASVMSQMVMSQGVTLVVRVSPLTAYTFDDNSDTEVRTLLTSYGDSSNYLDLVHWTAQGREEIYLAVNGGTDSSKAYLAIDPDQEIYVALSYDPSSSSMVLAVNGITQKVEGVTSFPDVTAIPTYLGIGRTAFTGLWDLYQPRSLNGHLKEISVLNKSMDMKQLQLLTRQKG